MTAVQPAEALIGAVPSEAAGRVSHDWLALRERADAAARAPELLEPLRAFLDLMWPDAEPLVLHDVGCGTGSQARWLSGRLRAPQRWILHDRDPVLLREAVRTTGFGLETREGDLTDLRARDFAGGALVTASALLDLLTRGEVDRLAEACVAAGCPALFTLSVAGAAVFTPPDPLDGELSAAFNDHQRRVAGGRRLLGPDAVDAVASAFARRGAVVRTAASPWRLGPDDAALAEVWLRGWVDAACEQRPELRPAADDYLRRRLVEAAAGELGVVVHHVDVLALPPGGAAPAASEGARFE